MAEEAAALREGAAARALAAVGLVAQADRLRKLVQQGRQVLAVV